VKTLLLGVLPFLLAACEPAVKPIAKALTCGCPRVVVEGVLENRGPGYFNNPKFVLKDASGEVEVKPWLPLEVAPYHPDVYEEMQKRGDKWPPETMAEWLNAPIRLYGRIDGSTLFVEHAEKVR